jgi:hypothetical protein
VLETKLELLAASASASNATFLGNGIFFLQTQDSRCVVRVRYCGVLELLMQLQSAAPLPNLHPPYTNATKT